MTTISSELPDLESAVDKALDTPGIGRAASKRRKKTLTYVGLVAASSVAVFPLLFMMFSSLKPDSQIFSDLGTIRAFLPIGDLSLDNYVGVFQRVPAARFLMNSVIVTVGIVGCGLVVNSMIGFAISRMRWKGKNVILSLVLATLMVPFETIAVPLVFWVAKLPHVSWVQDGFLLDQSLLNTYSVQILPFIANALAIFLFAQHFSDIPKEIDEAARVDGAGWWTIYRKIAVPLSGPTFATVAIITMLPAWNSYLWPLMVVQEEELRPVSVGMQYFFQLNPVWGEIMAYGTLITLPVLMIFVAFQRSFVASLAGTAVKG
ncbi:carbohydrate ABC transporter permease [Actinomyces slackii]|uniref:Inner membrane ABC transporter permease protein ycjP n=1 Tax=Actinomyces slackii TaxID=52774 RepID=A0A448KEW1_9ACTO|nr:carbohydrate ABC transporter permease [Actinomyces slackii]VEG75442.1 Inner membrane ABC transporter permease protein ycjP [Actinomyces slackii]